MRYKLLGNSGLKVSEVCLGTMTFGTDWGWGADKETSRQLYDTFREAGGNFIDTADGYTNGTSEKFLGKFIEGHRDEVVLATKYTNGPPEKTHPNRTGNSRKRMMAAVEGSLQRLQTDYIDLLWVHTWDFLTPVEEVMRGLDDLVRQGKVLYVGISDAPAWVVSRANAIAELRGWTPFDGLQIEYSLIGRTPERELLPMAQALGLTTLAWSPLAGGLLTGKYSREDREDETNREKKGRLGRLGSMNRHKLTDRNLSIAKATEDVAEEIGRHPAQVALAWVRQRGAIPLLGATKLRHMESNLQSLEVELSEEHMEALNEASTIELGFPHDFLESRKQIVYGGYYEDIDGERRGIPLHW